MVGVIGINHKTAPQAIRGSFTFTKEEIVSFANRVQQYTDITEIVVLSTCHRTEVYYYSEKSDVTDHLLIDLLHDFKGVTSKHNDNFYRYSDLNAVKHLFKVISGLDSMVIGEDQIVNQVKDAYMHCTKSGLTDVALMRLFQKSLETGKRVRTETALQQGPTSISYVAVDLCSKLYGNLADKSVLFIGAGETISTALHNFKKRGVNKIYIANRTYDNALQLAKEYDSTVIHFDEIQKYLPDSDIVIVATGAQQHLICHEHVRNSITKRKQTHQIYIDLSVPRNIEESIGNIDNIQLFCIDDFHKIIDSGTKKQLQSIEKATSIIDDMAIEYMDWYDSLSLRPLIKTITMNFQKIRESEMLICKDCEGNINFKVVDEYTNRLTQKYIGTLIKNLKEIYKGNPSHSLDVMHELFSFEQNKEAIQ